MVKNSIVSSVFFFFFVYVYLKQDQTYVFRVFRRAISAKRAEEQQTRATGEGAPRQPRASLRSPENAKK